MATSQGEALARLFALIVLFAALIALAACGANVQTSSGAEYLARYPASGSLPAGGGETGAAYDIDTRVAEVAAVEPILRLPGHDVETAAYEAVAALVPKVETMFSELGARILTSQAK
ncbi:MAG: hypothetical protein H6923_02935 [Alphaproteobacteria bacterium]|nr:hypothetical protein [Alphaproteobacteria bacterium]